MITRFAVSRVALRRSVAAVLLLFATFALMPVPGRALDLFVVSTLTNSNNSRILLLDGQKGTFIQDFTAPGIMREASFMTFGPDNDLYVTSEREGVFRFDGTTGASLGLFTTGGPSDVQIVRGPVFGPDGNMYVSDSLGNGAPGRVLRYDGTTGAFLDAFVPTGSGGLGQPAQLVFGPDGNLYVTSTSTNAILRYNGTTGDFIDAFVPPGDGGLASPIGLTFGPDGNLYISTDNPSNTVMRYDGVTGAFMAAFVGPGSGGLMNAYDLAFSPGGDLFVSSYGTNQILRYNGTTGTFEGVFASRSDLAPIGLVFRGQLAAAPEPSALPLLLCGLFGAAMIRRRARLSGGDRGARRKSPV